MQLDFLPAETGAVALGPGATLLRGFAREQARALADLIGTLTQASPFRHLETPGGKRMSVAMTNCGRVGWVSDRRGYRYAPIDPLTRSPWPVLPVVFADLARDSAVRAGYPDFRPDACLVNRYEPGARLALHRDQDEEDLEAPIVSVSIGLPATFLWGEPARSAPTRRFRLESGDVAVWGGQSRLVFHGVAPLTAGMHPVSGGVRYNLTFRKVFRDAG